jgi:hypothetical protein
MFEGLEYKGFDPKAAASSQDLRTFDDAITRVSFGFKSVDDYYTTCSSVNKVPSVAIPLLCMQVRSERRKNRAFCVQTVVKCMREGVVVVYDQLTGAMT